MTTDLYNQEYKKVGTVTLPDPVFNSPWNADLVHQVVVAYEANLRKPLAHVKGRAEVRGGGKKPYAQKHTGRSRQGSTRSPIWKGGGVTHGPTAERNFSKKVNKKMRQGALSSVLSRKLHEGEVFVVDSLSFEKGKTKEVASMLARFFKAKPNVLFVSEKGNSTLVRTGRNIPNVDIVRVTGLTAFTGLRHKNIIFEKAALDEFVTKQ
ncbi:MAG: 50S ribosomal protein L4 [Candidatus Paceibacterota bacterium]|jgi:large subunit ribosomal protein L4